jgi:hypothetical protein
MIGGIVGKLLEQRAVGGIGRVGAHHQRVAVGWRRRDGGSAELAAGARPVVDDDRLLQDLLQLGAKAARGEVGGAAGGEGHDDLDRLAGERLRKGFRRRSQGSDAGKCGAAVQFH